MTRDSVVEQAPAKINLHLRIVSREPDGYHHLETLFQALDLHDSLEARVADEPSLVVDGAVDTGPAEQNLVLRAARAFAAARPDAPAAAFRLTKRIPSGAGLGGGSSDAAAALRALNALARSPLGPDRLRDLGATLGADVAFFLCGSPLAWATGRGERLDPRAPLPAAPVLVVDPGFAVSTRDAFGWWDARASSTDAGGGADMATLSHTASAFAALRGAVRNDFESVVFARHSVLKEIRDALDRAGASIAMLSGSGSCIYGLFDSDAAALEAGEAVAAIAPRATLLHTRTRA